LKGCSCSLSSSIPASSAVQHPATLIDTPTLASGDEFPMNYWRRSENSVTRSSQNSLQGKFREHPVSSTRLGEQRDESSPHPERSSLIAVPIRWRKKVAKALHHTLKRRGRIEAGARAHQRPPPAPPAKIWLWCLSGGPKSFGFSSRAFYLQNAVFIVAGPGFEPGPP
jgi:hypothetical protein